VTGEDWWDDPSLIGMSLAEQQLAATEEIARLRGELAAIKGKGVASYVDDPVGFVNDCVKFRPGKDGRPRGLADYQAEILGDLQAKKRVAVRGPRGLGKSGLASFAILWFAVTRDACGMDWKIVTTAGSWQQLEDFLWQEITKWAISLDWEKIGRPPFSSRTELMKTQLRLRHGLALAGSPDKPDKLEGAHADQIFYVFDESKIISAETFDAAEGAFSGAGEDSDLEAFALAISTPGEPSGRFYDIHARKPGLEDWHTRHVTLEEAIAARRMTREWADRRKRLWGENSALYQNHVLGEFCADDEDAMIPLAWVEAAVLRWRAWDAAGRPDPEGPQYAGVDVARSGRDKSAIAIRHGNIIVSVETFGRSDTMETTGKVKRVLDAHPGMRGIIDVIGIGAGVYDRAREQGLSVDPFNAAQKTMRKDKTGLLRFVNMRSFAWWSARDALNPAFGSDWCIPPDDELIGDLTAMHKKDMSDGRIMAEPKDDVRKRLGRSTDKGDAVISVIQAATGGWAEAYGTTAVCSNARCGRSFRPDLPDGSLRTHCPHCRTKIEDAEEEAA